MEDVLYYNELYDLYGKLLTDKQQQYFEDYYFNNLSFREMADNYSVSRNAIFKQLKITKEKLEEFESILKLRDKNNKLRSLIENIKDENIKNKIEELL